MVGLSNNKNCVRAERLSDYSWYLYKISTLYLHSRKNKDILRYVAEYAGTIDTLDDAYMCRNTENGQDPYDIIWFDIICPITQKLSVFRRYKEYE